MIHFIDSPISLADAQTFARESFGDMVKGVVDLEKRRLALGGEMHSDAEELLLAQGSTQEHLWGFNLYPFQPREEWIEYTSLINIRPRQQNRSMEVEDEKVRLQMKQIINELIKNV